MSGPEARMVDPVPISTCDSIPALHTDPAIHLTVDPNHVPAGRERELAHLAGSFRAALTPVVGVTPLVALQDLLGRGGRQRRMV